MWPWLPQAEEAVVADAAQALRSAVRALVVFASAMNAKEEILERRRLLLQVQAARGMRGSGRLCSMPRPKLIDAESEIWSCYRQVWR